MLFNSIYVSISMPHVMYVSFHESCICMHVYVCAYMYVYIQSIYMCMFLC